ncbi:hypothetical protein IVB22_26580 [Bradyrhizobium sp. 190]|uniref:hypothetical protein n=1 Tax=Bradyrhizobium sp. 190 TaxID=2782658 RepID=UPI001FF9F236|nr:hypothetical protein [Bradyrhizobium sp. 190]MCK1516059.1 hypothetical protein [Bradyrhizobium sp. 190]
MKLSTCAEAQHDVLAGFLLESCSNLLGRLREILGNRVDARRFGAGKNKVCQLIHLGSNEQASSATPGTR